MKGKGFLVGSVMFAATAAVIVVGGAWLGQTLLGSVISGAVLGVSISGAIGVLGAAMLWKYLKPMK